MAVIAAIPLIPIALAGAAMGNCTPGARCIGNDWFVPLAILICALLGLAIGGIVHAVTRDRGD